MLPKIKIFAQLQSSNFFHSQNSISPNPLYFQYQVTFPITHPSPLSPSSISFRSQLFLFIILWLFFPYLFLFDLKFSNLLFHFIKLYFVFWGLGYRSIVLLLLIEGLFRIVTVGFINLDFIFVSLLFINRSFFGLFFSFLIIL